MDLYFGLPQIIYLALICLGMGMQIARDGESTEHNALMSLVGQSIVLSLLYWGGFFSAPNFAC